MQFGWEDYYGEEGCCLTCDEQEDNEIDDESGKCLCYDCKCRQCYWYQLDTEDWEHGGKGHCEYPRCNSIYEYDNCIFISKRLKETEKVIYCILEGFKSLTMGYYWVPKSQIKEDQIKSWWLDEKGLLDS